MFLGFCGRFVDLLFVTRLDHRAAVGVTFVKQLREEAPIPVFVEDQFGPSRSGVGLGIAEAASLNCAARRICSALNGRPIDLACAKPVWHLSQKGQFNPLYL